MKDYERDRFSRETEQDDQDYDGWCTIALYVNIGHLKHAWDFDKVTLVSSIALE